MKELKLETRVAWVSPFFCKGVAKDKRARCIFEVSDITTLAEHGTMLLVTIQAHSLYFKRCLDQAHQVDMRPPFRRLLGPMGAVEVLANLL